MWNRGPSKRSSRKRPLFWISEVVAYESFDCTIIANEQAEWRRWACEAATLMPREVLQQKEKFSCCEKRNVRCRFPGDFSGVRFHVYFHVAFDDLSCKQTFKVRTLFSATLLYLYELLALTYKCYFPFAVWNSTSLRFQMSKQKNKSDFKAKSMAEM